MPYLVRVSVQVPSWIQVLITYDRYVQLAFPNSLIIFRNKKFIVVVVAVMTLLLLMVNAPNLYFGLITVTENATIADENGTKSVVELTTVSCTSTRHVVLARDLIGIVCRTLVPFVFIFYGNFLLVRLFIDLKQKMFQKKLSKTSLGSAICDARSNQISALNHYVNFHHSQSDKVSETKSRKESSFIMSIIAIDMFFLATLLPLAISLIMINVFQYMPETGSPKLMASAKLTYYIAASISLWACICPFVFTFIFNRHFRREFIMLLIDFKDLFYYTVSVY